MLTLNAQILKASTLISSSEETRYYLKGVFVEATAETVTYVATDGHRLIAFRHDAEWEEGVEPEPFSCIVPSDFIATLKVNKKFPDIFVSRNGEMFVVRYYDAVSGFKPIDGSFPNWRAIIPEETDGKLAQFNAEYLASFKKAAKMLGADKCVPIIRHNGEGVAALDLALHMDGVDYVAFIMPLRWDKEAAKYTRPEWTR